MSSNPDPSPLPCEPADQDARDRAATSSLVDEFVACRSERAVIDAREIRTLAAVASLVEQQRSRLTSRESVKTDMPARTMIADLATAARLSERTIQRQLNDAADLCARFSGVVDALAAARISRAHVSVIHEVGFPIDDAVARAEFVSAALSRAETMTAGRLRPVAETLAARLNPRTIQERHVEARTRRSVQLIDLADAMSKLDLTIPSVLAHGIFDRLTQDAHSVIAARPAKSTEHGRTGAPGQTGAPAAMGGTDDTRESNDTDDTGLTSATGASEAPATDIRTMDQLRADIVCDLLLAGTAETCSEGEGIDAIRATVQITVPVLTAAGVGTEPALLAGYGPVDPESARRLLANAPGWERVMTSPVTGCVLAVDRYRASRSLSRFLRARDERCRFPGCRQPVWRCDIDHTHDAARGGATSHCNLAHLCKRHHTLKHNSHWRVRQLEGGVLEWTSPTGRIYTDLPEPAVRFEPDPEPPPF
ncbi:HNH endonuclease signature motif containing protein [Microbacterium pumilum]|uniref:DUF222 domain-containing protein n=1 Tax=Microbacterium pumilum TaxID=344165 RepID=A0ABN2SST4_9MICO